MTVSIVPFAQEHISSALQLWLDSPGVRLNDADTPSGLARFLERNPGVSFVAVDGDRVIGTLLCGHDGRRGYLQHMAVAEPYRRSGLGRQLVACTLQALTAIEIHKAHVFVVRENPFAGLFWERLGWQLRDDVHIYSTSIEQLVQPND